MVAVPVVMVALCYSLLLQSYHMPYTHHQQGGHAQNHTLHNAQLEGQVTNFQVRNGGSTIGLVGQLPHSNF